MRNTTGDPKSYAMPIIYYTSIRQSIWISGFKLNKNNTAAYDINIFLQYNIRRFVWFKRKITIIIGRWLQNMYEKFSYIPFGTRCAISLDGESKSTYYIVFSFKFQLEVYRYRYNTHIIIILHTDWSYDCRVVSNVRYLRIKTVI
jgi:hypothetical protein